MSRKFGSKSLKIRFVLKYRKPESKSTQVDPWALKLNFKLVSRAHFSEAIRIVVGRKTIENPLESSLLDT